MPDLIVKHLATGLSNLFSGHDSKIDPVTVYQLDLGDDGSPSKEKSYIRLPAPFEPYILRMVIAAGSRASKCGILFTNFPLDGTSDFSRSKFHQQKLPADTSKPIQIDLQITKAGVFEFYFEYDFHGKIREKSKSGYFNVDPIISVPGRSSILDPEHLHVLINGEHGGNMEDKTPHVNLPLDGLVIQSVVAKWMGKLTDWPPYLDNIRDRGYNMIHFTPLQERGESGSPYSIFDQLRFDPDLFGNKKKSAEKEREDLEGWLKKIKVEWGILSLTDVVWNHTANNTSWLRDHPDSGYNIINSPHLEPALVLDTALLQLTYQLSSKGLPTDLKSDSDLAKIMSYIELSLIPQLKLWEYYVLDVDQILSKFQKSWGSAAPNAEFDSPQDHVDPVGLAGACLSDGWESVSGPRSHATLKFNIKASVGYFQTRGFKNSNPAVIDLLKRFLHEINLKRYREYDNDLNTILQNIRNRIRYTRLEDGGPKMGQFDEKHPLIETLFTRLEDSSQTKAHDPRSLALANNGWIWNANPLEDFASPTSKAYLLREVIVWSDCVKLRYGNSERDNPFLWKKMKDYTALMARLFDGFRIDNCHSTPIHVGEALLDVARSVRPNLYVCAELFTGSEDMDTYFVSRLGINSLIREAMNGHDPKDQSSLLYNYGLGKPIGSMDTDCLIEQSTVIDKTTGKPKSCQIVPLHGSRPHAFLMDCTHDNESPSKKRTSRDALSTGMLVAFSYAAVGSNKGFDDLYPELLDLVKEKRLYEVVEMQNGIGVWKRILNHLHTEMVLEGYKEGHFHQENEYIISHRVHPSTHQGFLLVAHTAFHGNGSERGDVEPMRLRGTKAHFLLGSTLEVVSDKDPSDKKTLRGLPSKLVPVQEVKGVEMIRTGSDGEGSYVDIIVPPQFPPGSVMLFSTCMESMKVKDGQSLESFIRSGTDEAFASLSVVDLNILLFRTDGEERDLSGGRDGIYHVPGLYPPLTYCGLEGWMHPLRYVIRSNDLGHPLCAHLRDGTWAFDYVVGRLKNHLEDFPNLDQPVKWLQERVDLIKRSIPAFLRPKYFALLISSAYRAARSAFISQCSEFVRNGTNFIQTLAMSAVQMYGLVKSSSLDPGESVASVAAGLPHFSSGWARTWGRDCGISAGGLFVRTGLWEPARAHILCFCSTLKHGLMPNLLDSVKTPRYNSRDAPWFILQLLQDYVRYSSEGEGILDVLISRRFPSSDEWVSWDDTEKAYVEKIKVVGVIEEVLERHAQGIHFREYNAGPNLDRQMKDHGFDIDIEVDWETGFIHGGNENNCGTWMDKMGESEKAGNKGFPGTPRDGAPVEITGLVYSTLRWIERLAKERKTSKKGVEVMIKGETKKTFVGYGEWADRILANFEKKYHVPLDPEDDGKFEIEAKLVTRRGIYKDVYGTPAGRAQADYQLRPNFPIAMAVAPELFEPKRAQVALEKAREVLMAPLGMKTLDPAEPDYRPNYDNSNDSDDWLVAKGRNYHQGPEWVWPVGYFLRAYLHFDSQHRKNREETVHEIHSMLAAHRKFISENPWAGLPELTNENGAHCGDSCESQAWSSIPVTECEEWIDLRHEFQPEGWSLTPLDRVIPYRSRELN